MFVDEVRRYKNSPQFLTEAVQECIKKDILKDIAKFHAQFEAIHLFQDGNGEIGRILLLKQCLDADIVPVIIRDENKAVYYHCLENAQLRYEYVSLIEYFEKEQKMFREETIEMIFDYDNPEFQDDI